MRRFSYAIVLGLWLALPVQSHAQFSWIEQVQQAQSAYEAEDYERAAALMQEVLEQVEVEPDAVYFTAIAHARAGHADDAFRYLERAVQEGYPDLDHLNTFEPLAPLRTDPRWEALMALVATTEARRDAALWDELLRMIEADQAVRQEAMEALQRGGQAAMDSVLWNPDYQARVRDVDHRHRARIEAMLDAHGWPGRSLVADDGSHAFFLLVQHVEDLPFQERALALLLAAAAQGEARWTDAAYLHDRVLMKQGKPQLYGTQLSQDEGGTFVLHPIEDEANVDRRRAEIGLPPLAEYLAVFGIVYEPLKR